jgi:chromosomal replication initiation ATPase DnaA
MYLTHVICGVSLTEVGKIFQRDRTTAAYGCRIVEDLRDDPLTDRILSVLEAALVSLLSFNLRENT